MAKDELDIDTNTNTDAIMKTNATTDGKDAKTDADADADTDVVIFCRSYWHIYLSPDPFLSFFQLRRCTWYNLINTISNRFIFRTFRMNYHAYCMDEPLSQIS